MKEKIELFFASKWKSRILGIFLIFLVLLFLFRAFRTPGHIIFWDIDFGFILQGYIDRISPLWNETWSTATFFNGTRFPFFSVLYYTVWLISDNPSLLEKSVIFSLLFLSGIGMFMLVHEILRLDREKGKLSLSYLLIFVISLGSAIYYAFNPWSIVRIQHIFLLVGYAFLPFIFYEVLHLTENIKSPPEGNDTFLRKVGNMLWIDAWVFRHIVFASILYVFAIGAVHYLFFAFFFIGSWYLYRVGALLLGRQWMKAYRVTYYHVLFWCFFILLLGYWIFPYIGASTIASVNPPSVNTIDSINSLARYSTFRYVLYLASYWWPMMDIENLPLSFWAGGGFILLVIFLGNLVNLRNKFVLYFLFWAILLTVLATGTRTEYFAPLYTWIVFENPLAGQMGFIFRDSNKIAGLLAFVFAILWGTGLAWGLNFLLDMKEKRRQEITLLKKAHYVMKGKNFFLLNGYSLAFALFVITTVVSYSAYLQPYYNTFVNHFYVSVPIPEDYVKLIEYQKKNPLEEKVLYLPRYESIISPGYQFAVTTWNQTSNPQRPTSSYDLFSTIYDTYNPLEGATTYLGHFYEYLDDYLSHGIGRNMQQYLSVLNIGKVLYHKDLVGLEDMQKKQLMSLGAQSGLQKEKEIGFFSVFSGTGAPAYFTYFPRSLFLFGGLKNLETIFQTKKFSTGNEAHIFVPEDPLVNSWKGLEKAGDIMDIHDTLDLLLSTLPKEQFFAPFDGNNYSDPFSRWAKMREDITDWKYHLKKLWITNWPWDFSWNRGFIFTYAPAMIDLEPYEYIHNKGKDIVDFKKMIDVHDLFESSDENSISIVLEKTDKYAEIPAIKGEVFQGESKIWRAGVMRPIAVQERMGYVFELVVSGAWVSGIHGKVKFLDVNQKEIGVDYVSAPRFAETFHLIKFSGNFITPRGAKTMIFELNSKQKPEKRAYWWVHDLKIKELAEYTKPNISQSEYEFKSPGTYAVFARAFQNTHGGEIGIHMEWFSGSVQTKTSNTNRFEWRNIGSVKISAKGKRTIAIENIEGFNALNMLAFMETSEYEKALKEVAWGTFVKSRQIMALEAENDFSFTRSIQSSEYITDLSNGRSVNLRDGGLETSFDIVQEADYTFSFATNNDSRVENQNIGATLTDSDGKKISLALHGIDARWIMVTWPTHLIPKRYTLRVSIQNGKKNLVSVTDLRRFDIRLDALADTDVALKPKDEIGCSYEVGLWDQVARYVSWKNNIRTLQLQKGFSCYWLVTTHTIVPVVANEEYLLQSILKQVHTRNFHMKIRYLDQAKKTISNEMVDSFEDEPDEAWLSHEKFITIPEGAAYAQIQFWQKQGQLHDSVVYLKDVFFERYRSLPGLDSVLVYDSQIGAASPAGEAVSYKKQGSMERTMSFSWAVGGWILQMAESFTPLWQWRTDAGILLKPVYSNLFLNGYRIPEGTHSISFSFAPERFLKIWVPLTIVTLLSLLSGIVLIEIRRRKNKPYPKDY